MSRISKKKLWKIMKENPKPKEQARVWAFGKEMTQEQWLKGYNQWKKKHADD